ncbi:hypothetical protein Nstercoris_02327 (plasmid) [Nitrosomonas stercoris]|uniref:Uncharacterized protein n=1 Tax=Nitrosomonas stercoris TaxID=1444684 RepID=A0A4Y1YQF0_9PROT|nr:hypothetical protein Nstercoris_02327 [Nitrosomonas stercoris]
MKILQVAFFCLFFVGCSSVPELEYPTGKESARQPINVLHPARARALVPSKAVPTDLKPVISDTSQTRPN